jgi:hypothetical protein
MLFTFIKLDPTQVQPLGDSTLRVGLQALPADIRVWSYWLTAPNTTAYLYMKLITTVMSFIVLTPGQLYMIFMLQYSIKIFLK